MTPEHVKIRLGDEFDDALRDAVRTTLAEKGAVLTGKSWGVGGSQEIESLEAMVGGERVLIEAETYVGLTMSGAKTIVERLVEAIRALRGK